MRLLAFGLLLAFSVLAAATLVARSPEREREALRHFAADEVARGRQFSFERRLLFWAGTLVELALLLWLALSGVAPQLAAAAERLAGGRWPLSVLLVGAFCFLAQTAVAFPFRLYGGLQHLRAWGLTERSFLSWLGDYGKALGVSSAIGAALLVLLYLALRLLPRSWWLAAGAGSGLLGVFFAFIFPIVIAPLFNRFVPLATTSHAALLPRIHSLAQAAGLPARDVLVMDASRQGRQTNAYFAGFGSSRRIVLFDTLLERHSPEEVLSVLAHEMGHWRGQHIVKGLALGTLGAFLGFFVLARLLAWAASSGTFALSSPHDPAGLPLILLLGWLGSFAAAPVQGLVSRAFERQADRAALELGGAPAVFIEAEKRLVRDNIANPAPSDLSILLFASHPSPVERIAAAEAWAARSRPMPPRPSAP